jgi:coenzyme F420 hydrogenase subunit beta
VGSPAGTTTLVIRTAAGKGFVDSAVRNNKLTLGTGTDLAAIEKLATAKIRKNTRK